MTKRRSIAEQDPPWGRVPLAGDGPGTGLPIAEPALGDRANPRWREPSSPAPGAQSLADPDGTSNVKPPKELFVPMPSPEERAAGTPQDQAARPSDPEVGRDNIREGRGGGTHNPALAEGGDNG
jgi:hypothetical protein